MSHILPTLIILTPAFPRNETETTWVPSQQLLVKHLKLNEPSLNIIVLSFLYPYERGEYVWNGVTVFSFDGMHQRSLKRLKVWKRIWNKLSQIHKSHKIVGILSFWCGECALIGKYFGRQHDIRHLCWICGQDAREGNKMIRYIRPRANELAGISEFVVDEFYRNYDVKPAYLLPNGIDRSLFDKPQSERIIDIMATGSLTALKQYDVFVRIISKLWSGSPHIKAIHCGDGPEKKKIQTMILELGLEHTIELRGEQPHAEVLKSLQQSKIFLHPSSYEGFSTACLEALYAGAHVVSFCRPMKKNIEHWHVVKNEEEMLAKTLELLTNPATSYASVLAYDLNDSAKRVMELFVGSSVNTMAG